MKDYIGEYRRMTGNYIGKHSRRGLTGRNIMTRAAARVAAAISITALAIVPR